MLKTPRLTEEQIDWFRRDGFIVLPRAFNESEAATIQEWSLELSELPEEPGKHWVYHEPSLLLDDHEIINRIENITPFHGGFRELAECLKYSVGQLFGENAVLFKEKINFKMPGGDGFKPHQDAQAGWEEYASYFINETNTRNASNPPSPPPIKASTRLTIPPIGLPHPPGSVNRIPAKTATTIKPLNRPTSADATSFIIVAAFFIVFLLFVLVCFPNLA